MIVKRKTSSTSVTTPVKAPAKTRSRGSKSAAGKVVRSATGRASKATAKVTKAKAKASGTSPAKIAHKSNNVIVHQLKPPPPPAVVGVIEHALGEMKAGNIKVLDVHELTDIADTLVIACGNSDRHVRAIADRVVEEAKKSGFRPMGVEGERDGEWVLVDLQDVIVHIMLPRVREFYRLESLWDVSAARREAARSA
jgi:ribosome-associated protein